MFRRFIKHPTTLIGGAILLLIFLWRFDFMIPVDRVIATVFYPIQTRLYALALDIRSLPFFRWESEREHDRIIETLTHERTALALQAAKYRFAADENETLRKMLKFREETPGEFVSARVLARRTDAGTFSAFLDRGELDGVRVGMPIISNNGVLVGRVANIYPSRAEAVFLPDPRFRAAVTLSSTLKTSGYIRGEGGVSIIMDLIPTEQSVHHNDLVITSGLDPQVPRGLIVGMIEQVLPIDQSLFKRASVQPLLSLNRITDVAILLPPTPR